MLAPAERTGMRGQRGLVHSLLGCHASEHAIDQAARTRGPARPLGRPAHPPRLPCRRRRPAHAPSARTGRRPVPPARPPAPFARPGPGVGPPGPDVWPRTPPRPPGRPAGRPPGPGSPLLESDGLTRACRTPMGCAGRKNGHARPARHRALCAWPSRLSTSHPPGNKLKFSCCVSARPFPPEPMLNNPARTGNGGFHHAASLQHCVWGRGGRGAPARSS